MSCPSTVHETYGHITWFKLFNKCIYRQQATPLKYFHGDPFPLQRLLEVNSTLRSPIFPKHSRTYIPEKVHSNWHENCRIRKPQAELAETMCLCWHLPHLLQHRHMVTPPRAFVRFLTLPNYLSVTSLNCIITRSSFPYLFKHQRRSSSRPELIERVLCCTLLCCTLLY